MFNQIRNATVVVIGAAVAVIMLGLAALIAIPVLIGVAALGFVARGMLNARIARMRREHPLAASEQGGTGEVIEGEWTVLDQRVHKTGRSR